MLAPHPNLSNRLGVRYMLPNISCSFFVDYMDSFYDYASVKQITTLLIKERVKVAMKNKLKDASPAAIVNAYDNNESLNVTEHIFMLMPPRDLWLRPRRRERISKQTKELKKTKQILTQSLDLTIRRHRKTPEKYPYIERLNSFIEDLRNEIKSTLPLRFTSLRINGKKKKIADDGTIILRPLCIFNSLKEKLLVSLASSYLSMTFDHLLHEEILSYRPPRHYHNSEQKVLTNRDNAIANLMKYRHRFARRNIYVTECDIQKYFDTINHDVIRTCFLNCAEKVKQEHPDFNYSSVGRIVDAYLDSYSFYNNILVENERLAQQHPPRTFESLKEHLFFERGCYNREDFENQKAKIGIPQGGALSGLMSNVILSTIDSQSILCEDDPQRFFCRYGDDIILMHTKQEKCRSLIDAYCKALTDHKLLYHEFQRVGDENYKRKDGTTLQAIWNQKSRCPFLWGRQDGEQDAMDWIGFLGYEVRYTGEIRIRRSSLDEKFKRLKQQYRKCVTTKWAKGTRDITEEKLQEKILSLIERSKNKGLSEAVSLNRNRYSTTQALKLNRYKSKLMYKMLYKIAKRNGLNGEQLKAYWQEVQERGIINYLNTLPNNDGTK